MDMQPDSDFYSDESTGSLHSHSSASDSDYMSKNAASIPQAAPPPPSRRHRRPHAPVLLVPPPNQHNQAHIKLLTMLQTNLNIAESVAQAAQEALQAAVIQDKADNDAAFAQAQAQADNNPLAPPPVLNKAPSAEVLRLQAISVTETTKLLELERQMRTTYDWSTPIAKASVPPPPLETKQLSNKKPRSYPQADKFRQDSEGKEIIPTHKLYHPTFFLKHLERLLIEHEFDVNLHLHRFVTQLMPGEANHTWAFDYFLSDGTKYAKRRTRYLSANKHNPTAMRDFVYLKCEAKFKTPHAAYAHLDNLQAFTWIPGKGVEPNFDELETVALLAEKDKNDDLVISALLRTIPLEYRVKLLEYVQSVGRNLSFREAKTIVQRHSNVLRATNPSWETPTSSVTTPQSQQKPANNANKRAGGKPRMPDDLWKRKPFWPHYLNPDRHNKDQCHQCGSNNHHGTDPACPRFAIREERKLRLLHACRTWENEVKAKGFEPGRLYKFAAGDDKHDKPREDKPRYKGGYNNRKRDREERGDRKRDDYKGGDRDHDRKRSTRRVTIVTPGAAASEAQLYDANDADNSSSDSDDHSDGITNTPEYASSFPRLARRVIVQGSLEDILNSPDLASRAPVLVFNASDPQQHHVPIQTLAIVDTGCEELQVSYLYTTRHKLPLLAPTKSIEVELAGGNPTSGAPTTLLITDQVLLTLQCNNGKRITSLANVTHQSDDMLLGDRERKAFGMRLINVPLQFDKYGVPTSEPAETQAPGLDEADLHRPRTTDGDLYTLSDAIPQADRDTILDAVADIMKKQEAIPLGNFSTHPDAVVHIDTDTTESCIKHQYPLSDPAQIFVTKWLADMLEKGTVVIGDPATKWINPLLVALDKKQTGRFGTVAASGPFPEDEHMTSVDDQGVAQELAQYLAQDEPADPLNSPNPGPSPVPTPLAASTN